ncbi:MAG: hypothetical protein IH840_15980 [Candidatus Heimdallarchaeota archaeon]|nr:hypothetical protein [Candidatus Heimdallarchaeota archaeon]
MGNYVVLGLGMMGEAIVYDLLEHDDVRVIGFEINENIRNAMSVKFQTLGERFTTQYLDLDLHIPVDENPLIEIFKELEITTAFGAIDYKFNHYLTELCILSGANYLDLGGNPDMVIKQRTLDQTAKENQVTIIPDLGLAPGMANVVAYHMMQHFDKVEECHIRVGGLPQPRFKKSILNYQQVFSIRGLTNEYLEEAIVIRNGKITRVESMTEVEELAFPEPFGTLEAFQTAGGTSSLPLLFENRISELTYKTIRYPGHSIFFKFLKDFELLISDPYPRNDRVNVREVVEFYLQKNLPKGDPDAVLVRIQVIGVSNNLPKEVTYQLIDLADEVTGFSAMARTTSFPISIIGQMINNGIIQDKGVVMGEAVTPEKEFMNELRKRNIVFEIT